MHFSNKYHIFSNICLCKSDPVNPAFYASDREGIIATGGADGMIGLFGENNESQVCTLFSFLVTLIFH